MTSTVAAIRGLCGALAFYADRLDLLRAKTSNGQLHIDGATYLADEGGYGAISPWYRVIDPIYAELDAHVRRADRALCEAVFADPDILAIEAKLHRIRACYEFDKEFDQARAILESDDPGTTLAELVAEQAYWALAPGTRETLSEAGSIAVVGSGPLPLTALAIAASIGSPVTCIERDHAASALGRKMIEASGHGDLIDTVEAGVDDVEDLSRHGAVICAVLLGVSMSGKPSVPKAGIIERIVARSGPGTLTVLRDPFGLGRLFYPPADLDSEPALEIERHDPETGPDLPYRSSFLLIRRALAAEDHARSSAASIHS